VAQYCGHENSGLSSDRGRRTGAADLRGDAEPARGRHAEAWLRMHADLMTEIRFLGRFDAVQAALSQQEAEDLMLERKQDLLLPGNGNSSTIPACPGRATKESNP